MKTLNSRKWRRFVKGRLLPSAPSRCRDICSCRGCGPLEYVNVQYPWDGKLNTQIGDPIPNRSLACYRKSFTLPQNWLGKEVSVVFHGADCAIYVFCNGSFVGYGEDSATPSEFDLTPWLDFAGENTLVVQLFRRSSASWLEDQDFWRLSGLYRDVTLVARPECHLEDLFLHPNLNEDYTKGELAVEYRCAGAAKGYAVTAKLIAPDGSEAGKGGSCAWDGRFTIPVENPALWSGEIPNLYTLELWVVPGKATTRWWNTAAPKPGSAGWSCSGALTTSTAKSFSSGGSTATNSAWSPAGWCRKKPCFRTSSA